MDELKNKKQKKLEDFILKGNTEFSIHKEKGINCYYRADFTLMDIKKIINIHTFYTEIKKHALIKNDLKDKVSIFDYGEKRICVKQFCYPYFWDRLKEKFRNSKGFKAWVGGNSLKERGIPCIKPLALVERKNWFGMIESFFIMEAFNNGEGLDRYIGKGFDNLREKRNFIKNFAGWLSNLHQKNIYHKDMKASNILVRREGEFWDFILVDMEDLIVDKKVTKRKIFKNLIQLNTSIHEIITNRDRLRFFKEYFELRPILKNEKAFLKKVIIRSKQRKFTFLPLVQRSKGNVD